MLHASAFNRDDDSRRYRVARREFVVVNLHTGASAA
jgi:hypothetical protein